MQDTPMRMRARAHAVLLQLAHLATSSIRRTAQRGMHARYLLPTMPISVRQGMQALSCHSICTWPPCRRVHATTDYVASHAGMHMDSMSPLAHHHWLRRIACSHASQHLLYHFTHAGCSHAALAMARTILTQTTQASWCAAVAVLPCRCVWLTVLR